VTRLQPWRKDAIDGAAVELWESITDGRRGTEAMLTDEAGGLIGPFNAFLRSPALGQRMLDVGSELRFGASIEPRLLELAIVTVCGHWHAEMELLAHSRMARKAGVDMDVIAAAANGEPVVSSNTDNNTNEVLVNTFVRELLSAGVVSGETYRRAVELLGEQQVFELVAVVGFYCFISFTINAFEVPTPPGLRPR